jgi:chromosome partitioning protein
METRILAAVNQKGGVCKTTITAQIAYRLAALNKHVLAIDMDPQGNLTTALGVQGWNLSSDPMDECPSPTDAYTVLDKREMGLLAASPKYPRLHVVPSDINLAQAEMGFISRPDWQFLLTKAIKGDDRAYDFIIIDSPPNLGLLTINTLMAATEVIIPLTCDTYAFNGLAALRDTIETVKTMNHSLSLMGVVAARVNAQRNIDKESLKRMDELFPDILFRAKIPENTALKEAGGLGKSIWEHAPGSLASSALADLCDEILERRPA